VLVLNLMFVSGGFTVLSTKAFSTLLTMEAWAVFKEWITYPILAVLPTPVQRRHLSLMLLDVIDIGGHWYWSDNVFEPCAYEVFQ